MDTSKAKNMIDNILMFRKTLTQDEKDALVYASQKIQARKWK